MKTVQMTLEEDLVAAVDRVTRKLKTTRSAFTRDALRDALVKYREKELEQKHRLGYERQPVAPGEFDVWHTEQDWGDA
jgi:metal-responsive CopG/Arc/MetJ family transcriptional regulator